MSCRCPVRALLLVAAGLMGCGESRAGEPLLIPSTMCQGLFLVPAEFGEEQLQLVLDTGADSWSLDPDAVERVRNRRIRHGKKVTLRKGIMGPLKLDKISARVHELDHLALALGHPIDGIIGFNTFEDFLLTLDYPARTITVEYRELPAVDGISVFEDFGQSRPFIRLELGDQAVPLLIDSGFSGGLDLNAGDPLSWQFQPVPVSVAVRYTGVELKLAGRMSQSLQVGPLLLRNPVTHISEGTRLLGAEVLQYLRLAFDQKNRRIQMQAVDRSEIESAPLRDWGLGFRPRAEGLEVTGVFKSTPAEAAGIRAGDLLLSIDGEPVHERGCRPLDEPRPLRALLHFRRGQEELTVELETAVLVP